MAHAPSDAHADERRLGAALRDAATALARARDDAAALAALGVQLDGTPPSALVAQEPAPTVALDRSIEAWGFAAGIRRVAFVTVAADAVDRTLAQFPGAHVERRARQVEVGPQDRWHDDRARGAPRIELYLARDPALARRAATLQADDPTRHGPELGALLGYPPCCVAAFLAQAERGDNSLNRYLAAARTRDDDDGAAWPWPLNDLHLRLIAFYPCSYRCPAALAVARATVEAIAAARPAAAMALAAALTATVLYVDHDHQVWLRDATGAGTIRYRGVTAIGAGRALPALARVVAAGDRVIRAPGSVAIAHGDHAVARLGPLGLVARFG
ncbi:MAG: hypothetical protein IPL61_03805 [Myxococcales bacterium]|nr:hypothetical protein [Myxococcales bacterium]